MTELEIETYNLNETINKLKSFHFPFLNSFQDYEYDEIIEQVNRIKLESESYIRFLKYSKDNSTK